MNFSWVSFYEAMADKLLTYNHKRKELFDIIKSLAANNDFFDYLHFDNAEEWAPRNYEIDPFSVIAIFNRGQSANHRQALGNLLAQAIGVKPDAPENYEGIPHLYPRKSIFNGNEQMWNLLATAVKGPHNPAFASSFDAGRAVKGNGLGTLSIGLFWVRPNEFMAVDTISEPYIEKNFGLHALPEKCGAAEYIQFLDNLKQAIARNAPDCGFPCIAHTALCEKKGC